jgi:hypothetical protein
MRLLYLCSLLFLGSQVVAQPYIDGGNTRHRFAQLVVGADLVYFPSTGQSVQVGTDGQSTSVSIPEVGVPRLSIAGTHFWGHAYFYVSFPLGTWGNQDLAGGDFYFSPSVETGARVYPWRVQEHKIRPFIGAAWSLADWRQRGPQGQGVFESKRRMPLQLGLTYQHQSWLLDLGYGQYLDEDLRYAVAPGTFAPVTLPRRYFWLGLNYQLETTAAVERDYLDGTTAKRVAAAQRKRALSGFSLAIGPSAAFIQGTSPRNDELYPELTAHRGVAVFPDIGLGYYHYPWDFHLNLAFRRNGSTRTAFGVQQQLARTSIGLEAFKFLFDYHGFVPFVGPILSRERLQLTESIENQSVAEFEQQQWALGLTFGWDIRPDALQPWLLRTNLRYTPLQRIGDEGGVSFSQIEFNFIQFVWYPGRSRRINR